MAEPTLQQVFGANAVQDATTLTISKADLTGLTASASNRAEALFVAILLKAKSYLTETNYDSNTDQSITIVTPDYNAQSLVTRGTQQYRQYTENINLFKIDNTGAIDPDDF